MLKRDALIEHIDRVAKQIRLQRTNLLGRAQALVVLLIRLHRLGICGSDAASHQQRSQTHAYSSLDRAMAA
ncbi:hypothetical protein HMPREF3113_13815 [Stenotrophomonas sp. HMSC10F06]|nr:hypothetical protein HMPREF3113_13815 [Stenotrophomonas sp. HMSC10F06]